ncbi:uncharacterized protein PHACADRAFT_256523 [Phanerochaete carnosa HHB-10118-sp]|uniref:Uncharacterized protein n=1 Tax=Phanerochaete carnosa (strain HHB-10118-sp) TaxID=650164 RepID=K5W9Q8_PHACS|nr:uncharacterized protein PHACADRAFT_256523 [Phanerochaete carnosa HHB-10118-sp]EKM55709.1 hypothetical protein PHACADRAFT_256523 [Phanerochaete carnosa HHB-10118-sp]
MSGRYDTYDMPPHTCNTLDHCQRARLIRSTRKLGAVLGTTPRFAEADECPLQTQTTSKKTKAARRHASVFTLFPEIASFSELVSRKESTYSTSSSNSSLLSLMQESRPSLDVCPTPKSLKGRRSAEGPRPLVLRINTVPVSHVDTRVPLSSCAGAVPITPTCSDGPQLPSDAEVRRRRMAKLKRTLGENIPPEMVFASLHAEQAPSVTATPPPKRSSEVWVTADRNGTWVGEWNRSDIGEVQRQLRNLRAR